MNSLVFLDAETTGFNGSFDRIIELYMLSVDRQGDAKEYHTLINPNRPLPSKITELTGLSNEDFVSAPFEADVAASIRAFIGEGILVAHNLNFDRKFLNAMFTRSNCPVLGSGGLDTMVISRKLFPKLCIYEQGGGSHKLRNLMYHFQLDTLYANSHRAKDDVMLLIQVYRKLEAYANAPQTRYPKALTHGCPSCGEAMYIIKNGARRELVCLKDTRCQQRLVV